MTARIRDPITGMRARSLRDAAAASAFAVLALALFVLALCLGSAVYSPGEAFSALLGKSPGALSPGGASFAVRELRFPRALTGILAGFAFGAGGATFQTLLRNPLASPDAIGINAGSSAAAVFCMLVLRAGDAAAFPASIAAGLATAIAVHLIGERGKHSAYRLILGGIAFQTGFGSLITIMVSRASPYDVGAALRWLGGSLNGATMGDAIPVAISIAACMPVLLLRGRSFPVLQLGDECARALGTRPFRDRLILAAAAVGMLSCAAAVTGPIASVSFLAGPIARAVAGTGRPSPAAAGFAGSALVLGADLAGQFAFGPRYPVGVVTGLLGAPYLLFLLARMNRAGDIE